MFIYLYSSLLIHVRRYTHLLAFTYSCSLLYSPTRLHSFMFTLILTYLPSLIHVHRCTRLFAFTHSYSPLYSPTRRHSFMFTAILTYSPSLTHVTYTRLTFIHLLMFLYFLFTCSYASLRFIYSCSSNHIHLLLSIIFIYLSI